MKLIESILADAAAVRTIRRDLHAHPELCFEEHRTSDLIAVCEGALRPLERTGLVDAEKVALALALALRFVPEIWRNFQEIREAQAEAQRITEAERARVREAGGLHIIGTERHEARRIDNQLRGRAGRQGDPGSSRFYLSLEDELLRRFAMDRVRGIMGRIGVDDGTPIEAGLLSRVIENAQHKVVGYNFDLRKHTVEFDDVMNQQRTVIYGDR